VVRVAWSRYIHHRLARPAQRARLDARRRRVVDDTLPSWAPSSSCSIFSVVFPLCFFRRVLGPGIMDDDVADDDLQVAVVLGARSNLSTRRTLLSVREGRVRKRVGGSRPGHRPNRPRDFDLGAHAILRDLFGVDGEPPVHGEDPFEERFRLPRPVFNRLFRSICNEPAWRQTINATGRPQAHAIQKVAAALRVFGYGEPFDRADEYCRLSRCTTDLYTRRLTHFIIDKWSLTYLRRPNAEELEHILTRNAARGLPGCMGLYRLYPLDVGQVPKGPRRAVQGPQR